MQKFALISILIFLAIVVGGCNNSIINEVFSDATSPVETTTINSIFKDHPLYNISRIAAPIHQCSTMPITWDYAGWNVNSTTHYLNCDICGKKFAGNHYGTSTISDGYYICQVCNYPYKIVGYCTHSFAWVCCSATQHKQICRLCQSVAATEAHTFSAGTTCTKCRYSHASSEDTQNA